MIFGDLSVKLLPGFIIKIKTHFCGNKGQYTNRNQRSFFVGSIRMPIFKTMKSACLFLLLLCRAGLAFSAAAPSDFEKVIQSFFKEHCDRCHNEKKHKGELRLDTLSRDFAGGGSAMHWADVMDRISSGEMPPEDEPQPKAEEAAKIVEWLDAKIKEGETARLAKREPVTFNKLTREEYANTIYDLLGVHCDATDPTGLPEDPNWNGFERIGSVLSLSPAHVEKYFAAAEIAQAMLRVQQAEAVIAARKKIVHGAVSMVEMALRELSEKNVVQFDEERKAAMVSNLLVVLCGESEVTPVINTGTLYN